mgnify:CR=1 FL=1
MTARLFLFGAATLICLSFPTFVGAADPSGIRAPSKEHPLRLRAGEPVELRAALPLFLTPPPGVQQPGIWKEWSVVLKRSVGAVFPDGRGTLIFRMAVTRIRPDIDNEAYIITAISDPWLPEGRYAIVLRGPGFRMTAPSALCVGSCSPPLLDVQPDGHGRWKVQPASAAIRRGIFELVVPASVPAVHIASDGQRLRPTGASWTISPDGRTNRLLQYPLSFQGHHARTITAETARPEPGRLILHATSRDDSGPICWQILRAESNIPAATVLWRFNDGATAQGSIVRQRRLRMDDLFAEATLVDTGGGLHRASLQIPGNRTTGGCLCTAAGATTAPDPLPLFFILFPPYLWE